jgi:hypothetical protein
MKITHQIIFDDIWQKSIIMITEEAHYVLLRNLIRHGKYD